MISTQSYVNPYQWSKQMGGGGKKKSKKKKGLSPKQKQQRAKLASLGRAPKSYGGPTKAQTIAKNKITAKKDTANKAASMGATSKSFTSGLPSYSSLTSPTEAKKTFSPKANKGPSFKQSVKMAEQVSQAPKVESSKDIASHDKPLFKSVPATGPAADVLAGPEFKRLHNVDGGLIKDGSLFHKNNPMGIPLAGGYGLLPSGEHGPYKEGTVSTAAEGSPSFEKKYIYSEKKGWQPFTEQANSQLGIGKSILTAFNPAAGMMIGGLFGGTPANAATVDNKYSPTIGGLDKMLGFDSTTGTFNESPGSTGLVGVTGGGLNIGGAGFNQSDGGGAASRAIRDMTSEQLADRYDASLDPNSFKGLSDGQTFGVGPVASGDAYAKGLNVDNKNVENIGRSILSRIPGVNVRKLADKEIADKRVKAAAFRQANLVGRKRGGGGARLAPVQPQQQLTPEEILEPQQVAPAQSSPAYQQAGMDNSRLMQIQNDAYSRQMSQIYNPMEVGGFNPLVRFFGRKGRGSGAFRKAFRRRD